MLQHQTFHTIYKAHSALKSLCIPLLTATLLITTQAAAAGPLRDHWLERQKTQRLQQSQAASTAPQEQWRDVAYGDDPAQRMDIDAPPLHSNQGDKPAPIILMVHGGGWRWGDKAGSTVIGYKVKHWGKKGYIFISTNYPMLPQANPVQQAEHVARALAFVQTHAATWGGDPSKVVLMGHSAGAHLVALLSSSPALAYAQGAQPWLGTVSLDSAAMNVVQSMQARHYRLYDDAFGADPIFWKQASPYHQLTAQAVPMLLVCSSKRKEPCPAAQNFAAHAKALGLRVEVLPQPLSHKEINENLGIPSDYTETVDRFLQSLGL